LDVNSDRRTFVVEVDDGTIRSSSIIRPPLSPECFAGAAELTFQPPTKSDAASQSPAPRPEPRFTLFRRIGVLLLVPVMSLMTRDQTLFVATFGHLDERSNGLGRLTRRAAELATFPGVGNRSGPNDRVVRETPPDENSESGARK